MTLNGFTSHSSHNLKSPYKILKSTQQISLPKAKWGLLYDSALLKTKQIQGIKKKCLWNISLKAGEDLKSFEGINSLLGKIFSNEEKQGRIDGLILVGGGSLGDAGAFVASVLRRGVRLIQIPSTFLSSIDSAFGGKTAINFASAKNQIGSYWPAEKVYLCDDLLPDSTKLLNDSLGEIMKTALLSKDLWQRFEKVPTQFSKKDFLKIAPHVIETKLLYVSLDPFEKTNIRKSLNLGHTVAHALEKLQKLSHGEAVAMGIRIEASFLHHKKKISNKVYQSILCEWEKHFDLKVLKKAMGLRSELLKKALLKDKKTVGSMIQIIAIKEIGSPHIESFPADDLVRFITGGHFYV